MLDDIAILIPCFNESQTIKKVIQDYRKELPEARIYVYDNNKVKEGINLSVGNMGRIP